MIRRREVITLIGAAAWPLAASAQQAAIPTIGYLHGGSASSRTNLVAAFQKGLEETGQVVGQNFQIEYAWGDDQPDRLRGLAADLARRHVTVIAAIAEPAVFAAKAATSTISTAFMVGDDPAKLGLVASLARPGGNMTGVNIFTVELTAKRLGLLHELIPPGAVIVYWSTSITRLPTHWSPRSMQQPALSGDKSLF